MVSANQAARAIDRVSIFPWSLVAAATTLFVLASMPNLGSRPSSRCGSARSAAWAGSRATRCSRRTSPTSSAVGRSPPSRCSPGWGCSCRSPCSLRWRVSWIARRRRGARDPVRARDRGDRGRPRRAQHLASAQAVPALATRTPHARAEAEAAAGHRVLHRLRGRGGLREGDPDPAGGGVPAGRGLRRPRDAGARGTDVGERVRELLLDPGTGKLDARTEALLFAASRPDGPVRDPAGARGGRS